MKTTRAVTDGKFIKTWLSTGTVVHVCIDNQKYFAMPNNFKKDQDLKPVRDFCQNLGAFTGRAGKRFPTIDIQAEILPKYAFCMTLAGFDVEQVEYDPATLTVNPARTSENEDRLRTLPIDLFDTDYAQHHVHIKQGALWEYDNGRAVHLRNKLAAFGQAKYFVTGLYGEACVPEFIDGVFEDAEIMVDPSLIWSWMGQPYTVERAVEKFKNKGVLVTKPGQGRKLIDALSL